jgi:hypothetical protein
VRQAGGVAAAAGGGAASGGSFGLTAALAGYQQQRAHAGSGVWGSPGGVAGLQRPATWPALLAAASLDCGLYYEPTRWGRCVPWGRSLPPAWTCCDEVRGRHAPVQFHAVVTFDRAPFDRARPRPAIAANSSVKAQRETVCHVLVNLMPPVQLCNTMYLSARRLEHAPPHAPSPAHPMPSAAAVDWRMPPAALCVATTSSSSAFSHGCSASSTLQLAAPGDEYISEFRFVWKSTTSPPSRASRASLAWWLVLSGCGHWRRTSPSPRPSGTRWSSWCWRWVRGACRPWPCPRGPSCRPSQAGKLCKNDKRFKGAKKGLEGRARGGKNGPRQAKVDGGECWCHSVCVKAREHQQ